MGGTPSTRYVSCVILSLCVARMSGRPVLLGCRAAHQNIPNVIKSVYVKPQKTCLEIKVPSRTGCQIAIDDIPRVYLPSQPPQYTSFLGRQFRVGACICRTSDLGSDSQRVKEPSVCLDRVSHRTDTRRSALSQAPDRRSCVGMTPVPATLECPRFRKPGNWTVSTPCRGP